MATKKARPAAKKAGKGKAKAKPAKPAKPAKKAAKAKAKAKPAKAKAKPAKAKKAAKPAKAKKAAKPIKAKAKPAKAKKPVARKPSASQKTTKLPRPQYDVYDASAESTMPVLPSGSDSSAAAVRSTTTLVQTVEIPASPAYVYRALLDSEQHSRFTGGGANIDPRVGGKFTAWDGYISGTTLELQDNRKIVQSWRTSEWPDDYDDSRLEITLAPSSIGTKLTMIHDSVPTSQAAALDQGWVDHYWEPLRKFFAAVAV